VCLCFTFTVQVHCAHWNAFRVSGGLSWLARVESVTVCPLHAMRNACVGVFHLGTNRELYQSEEPVRSTVGSQVASKRIFPYANGDFSIGEHGPPTKGT
jgi:hypothetical protein